MNARPEIKLTPEQELRMDLAWDVRIALRDGQQEVVRYAATSPNRQPAAHAVYEDSIGNPALTAAFEESAKAYARGDTFGRIGELFAKFMDGACAHYVETLADAIEDPERQLDVSFELAPRK
jgi:hypothetical protein